MEGTGVSGGARLVRRAASGGVVPGEEDRQEQHKEARLRVPAEVTTASAQGESESNQATAPLPFILYSGQNSGGEESIEGSIF